VGCLAKLLEHCLIAPPSAGEFIAALLSELIDRPVHTAGLYLPSLVADAARSDPSRMLELADVIPSNAVRSV